MERVAELLPIQAERTAVPGAKTSTAAPQLEKVERRQAESMEPTVRAPEAEAGETLAAFWFSLPAATTVRTPALKAALTALLKADETGPPSDRLMAERAMRPRVRMSLTAQL